MTDQPKQLLLTTRQAAELCGVSERTWRTWDTGGLVPKSVKVGRTRLRRSAELMAWIAASCPLRTDWESRYGDSR